MKATEEEGGEHARGGDCHALKRIDTSTIAELEKTTTTTTTKQPNNNNNGNNNKN